MDGFVVGPAVGRKPVFLKRAPIFYQLAKIPTKFLSSVNVVEHRNDFYMALCLFSPSPPRMQRLNFSMCVYRVGGFTCVRIVITVYTFMRNVMC